MYENDVLEQVRTLVCNKNNGTRRLVVLDRGFIFVGDLSEMDEQGFYTLTNCHNVRKWSHNGFGGLSRGANTAGATLDKAADLEFHRSAMVFSVPISKDWENE